MISGVMKLVAVENTPDVHLHSLRLFVGYTLTLSKDTALAAEVEALCNLNPVTIGGVDTRGLSSRSMEANAVPGLFVIGEAVDVTGWLGGYNFQWAWSSGWCAGMAV